MSQTNKRNSFKGFFATLGILAILGSAFGGYLYFKDNLGSENKDKVALASTQGLFSSLTLNKVPQNPQFTPDKTRIYIPQRSISGSANSIDAVQVLDVATNTIIATIPTRTVPTEILFNQTGTRGYVTNYNQDNVDPEGSISVIDTDPTSGTYNTVISSINLGIGSKPYHSYLVNKYNKLYVLMSSLSTGDTSIKVIDTNTNTIINTIAVGDTQYIGIVSPDQEFLYVLNSSRQIFRITTSNNSIFGLGNPATPNGSLCGCTTNFLISADGSKLFIPLPLADQIIELNTSTLNITQTINLPSGSTPTTMKFINNGSEILVDNLSNESYTRINLSNYNINTIPNIGNFSTLSNDGQTLYSMSVSSNTLKIVDLSNNSIVKTLPTTSRPYYALESTATKKLFVFNGGNGSGTITGVSIDIFALNIVTSSDITSASCTSPTGAISYPINCTLNTSSIVTGKATFTMAAGHCAADFGSGGLSASCSFVATSTTKNTSIVVTASGGGTFNAGNITINGAILDISPNTGTIAGGSNIMITGNGLSDYLEGDLDKSFNPGTATARINDVLYSNLTSTPRVFTSLILPNNQKYIGGIFSSYDGASSNGIARINADGSLDTTFNIGTGFSSYATEAVINSLARQSDGKIIVGGNFSFYNGISSKNIARLNPDGTIDSAFNLNIGSNISYVNKILIQPDGKIIVGGVSQLFNNHPLVRLNQDGTIDSSFNSITGLDNDIFDIALQANGKMIVVGNFTSYNGGSQNKITRINADGSLDTTFNIGTGASCNLGSPIYNCKINKVLVQPDGKYLIAGNFILFNNITRISIARLNADGSLDTTFDSGTDANYLAGSFFIGMTAMNLLSDGKIVVGVSPTTYNGNTTKSIYRLTSTGTIDQTYNGNSNVIYTRDNLSLHVSTIVNDIQTQPDGKLFVSTNSYSSSGSYSIAVLNPTTTLAKVELIKGATTLNCANMVVALNNVITCTTPSTITQGQYDVKVTNGDGTSVTMANGFTYFVPSTPLTPSDIPSLTVVCGTTSGSVTSAPVNSVTSCTFPLPSNKTLPNDFKLSIGNGSVNEADQHICPTYLNGVGCPAPFPNQSCTETASVVTCTNVPTGNSIGIIPVYGQFTGTVGSKTATGESVTITGINLGAINWIFNPDQGGTSPLFRSTDNTSITVNNFRTIFDPTPSSNTRYTCTLEYRNLNDRNSNASGTGNTWTPLNSTPIPYTTTTGTTQGCTVNLTKQQRANTLNHSLRLTITDTSITTPSSTNPNTYTFYNEYIFRFQGAGVASGG